MLGNFVRRFIVCDTKREQCMLEDLLAKEMFVTDERLTKDGDKAIFFIESNKMAKVFSYSQRLILRLQSQGMTELPIDVVFGNPEKVEEQKLGFFDKLDKKYVICVDGDTLRIMLNCCLSYNIPIVDRRSGLNSSGIVLIRDTKATIFDIYIDRLELAYYTEVDYGTLFPTPVHTSTDVDMIGREQLITKLKEVSSRLKHEMEFESKRDRVCEMLTANIRYNGLPSESEKKNLVSFLYSIVDEIYNFGNNGETR